MVKSQKDVFWKALILTIVIFLLGVLLGYFLEDYRISEIEEEYKRIEIEWADAKLQSIYYQAINPIFCEAAIKENLNFADKVYSQGLKLEKYDEANPLTESIILDKQRYALLKTEFWLNSISLKEKCKANYTNLIYFYANEPDIQQKSEQKVESVILKELKEKYGPQLMLIPLPIDLDISIINIMINTYNITTLPTILINEKDKLEGFHNKEDIENLINK